MAMKVSFENVMVCGVSRNKDGKFPTLIVCTTDRNFPTAYGVGVEEEQIPKLLTIVGKVATVIAEQFENQGKTGKYNSYKFVNATAP